MRRFAGSCRFVFNKALALQKSRYEQGEKKLGYAGLCKLITPLVHAWDRPEMAKYGAAYAGPELLYVYVAHNKADDHAVVKIQGINHPLDGHVFWTKIAYSTAHSGQRTFYIDETVKEEHLQTVLFIEGSSGILYLQNYRGQVRAEIKVVYDQNESRQTLPEHLVADYELQTGSIKASVDNSKKPVQK